MATNVELSLERLADSAKRPRAPRDLPVRLRLLAALLREAPAGGTGPRLLWRDAFGAVQAIAIDRPLVIGRDVSCDVVLASARVSRRHCAVQPLAISVEIEDLQSANGTFVNAACLARGLLRDGDVIEIGGAVLAYAVTP
jgi:hypothetical protein